MKKYIILLPNSEGKKSESNFEIYEDVIKVGKNSFSKLDVFRREIVNELLELKNEKKEILKKIFDIKDDKKLEYDMNNNLTLLSQNTNFAINRYSGVMFKAIDYSSMSDSVKNNFNNNVVFLDGLFGLLKPLDKIPNYKLKINSKLSSVNIEKFWKKNISDSGVFENYKNCIIIDLLPGSHRKVLPKYIVDSENYFKINFYVYDVKNKKNKNVGHQSKMLKGEFVNYICQNENIDLDYLRKFKHSLCFVFVEELSVSNDIIFLKK